MRIQEKQVLVDLARQRPTQIEIIDRVLNATEWAVLLERCDLLVAPYDAKIYSTCPSGIALESIANGIPLVMTKGTGMDPIFARHVMPARQVEDYSVAGFVKGIEDVLGHYSDVFEGAQRARVSWERENGPGRMANAILFSN